MDSVDTYCFQIFNLLYKFIPFGRKYKLRDILLRTYKPLPVSVSEAQPNTMLLRYGGLKRPKVNGG